MIKQTKKKKKITKAKTQNNKTTLTRLDIYLLYESIPYSA